MFNRDFFGAYSRHYSLFLLKEYIMHMYVIKFVGECTYEVYVPFTPFSYMIVELYFRLVFDYSLGATVKLLSCDLEVTGLNLEKMSFAT